MHEIGALYPGTKKITTTAYHVTTLFLKTRTISDTISLAELTLPQSNSVTASSPLL
jgi:hypothetical protein